MSEMYGPEYERLRQRTREAARLVFANAKAAVARMIAEMTPENAAAMLAEIEIDVEAYGPDTEQAAADLALARARHDELLAHSARR